MYKTHKVVVTMTSWTKRIGNCHQVVKSILNNTVKPDVVFLNLSEMEFPNKESDLPSDLVELSKSEPTFRINWVAGPNTKPWKKVFPILQYLQDDDLIIIVDDDLYIDEKLVETRVDEFDEYGGKCAISGGLCYASTHLNIPIFDITAYNTVCPTTLMQKRMLKGWESIFVKELYNPFDEVTYSDDCAYSLLVILNGFSIVPSKKLSIKRLSALDVNGLHKTGLCLSDLETIEVFASVYERNCGKSFRQAIMDGVRKFVGGMEKPLSLVMWDSMDLAGDNAEYLYREIRNWFPEIKMTFLLSNTSKDWERLRKDNFNLKTFNDINSFKPIQDASYVLFSKYNVGNTMVGQLIKQNKEKVIFLQHGTISQIYDCGFYLKNTISKLAKYILCSSEWEANLIKAYSQDKLVPIVSGLPRQDSLLMKYKNVNKLKPKIVFISFHWRYNLPNPSNSKYLSDINAFLNSKQLKELAHSGVKVRFLPHAMYMKFLNKFKIPNYIELPRNRPFQDLLVESDVLVTDFSSNSFEMAYMDKFSVIYVPGRTEVNDKHKKYHVGQLKYPHMIYCKTPSIAIQEIKNILTMRVNGRFAHSRRIFKNVDTNNTKRLVKWMCDNLEDVKKGLKKSHMNIQDPKIWKYAQYMLD